MPSLQWDGWLAKAEKRVSPNYNARPGGEVDLLVVHCISLPEGNYGGPWVDKLFLNQIRGNEHPSFADLEGLEVSAHFFIARDGTLSQYVSCLDRAWHAGLSSFNGRSNCNDFSLGVELEGCDADGYEKIQYQVLVELVKQLQGYFPALTLDRIVGHEHIAPGRKTDPGPHFAWQEFREELEKA